MYKILLAAICATTLSIGTVSAQPSQAQGGGQTGPNGNAGTTGIAGETSGVGMSRAAPGRTSGGAPQVTGDPNGTAGGPTTLSGTGPSTYGGNNPGAAR